MLRLNIMIDEEFRTDNGKEFQYLGPTTLRDEALELVIINMLNELACLKTTITEQKCKKIISPFK